MTQRNGPSSSSDGAQSRFADAAAPLFAARDEQTKRYFEHLVGNATLADCRFRVLPFDPSLSSASSSSSYAFPMQSPIASIPASASVSAASPRSATSHGAPVIIPAHRIVLSQYAYFSNLFSGDYAEDREILVENILPETMHALLTFIYTNRIVLDHSNAFAVYCAASQFCLTDLAHIVCLFLSECPMDDKLRLLTQAETLEPASGPLMTLCLEAVAAFPRVALLSPEFLHLSLDIVAMLLEGDLLGRAKEDDIYDAVLLWHSANQSLHSTSEALSRLFPLIRWGWLSLEKLVDAQRWLEAVPNFAPMHHKALLEVVARGKSSALPAGGAGSNSALMTSASGMSGSGCGDSFLRPRKRPRIRLATHSIQSRLAFATGQRITCVAVDGPFVYTGHVDHMIRCWDLATGQPRALLVGHQDLVVCVDARNGLLVSGARDNRVLVWELTVGQTIAPLHVLEGHEQSVYGVALAPGAIYSCSRDRSVRRWAYDWATPTSNSLHHHLHPSSHSNSNSNTNNNSNNSNLGNGNSNNVYNGNVPVVPNLAYGRLSVPRTTAPPCELPSSALSVTCDEHTLYVACGDGRVRIINGLNMTLVGELGPVHDNTMRCVHYCGPMIVSIPIDPSSSSSSSTSGTTTTTSSSSAVYPPYQHPHHHPQQAQPHPTFVDTNGYGIPLPRPSADPSSVPEIKLRRARRRVLVAGSTDGVVFFFDVDTRSLLYKTKRHLSKVFALAHSTQRNVVVSSSEDGTACVWNPDILDVRPPFGLYESPHFAVSVEEDAFVVGAGPQGTGQAVPATIQPNPHIEPAAAAAAAAATAAVGTPGSAAAAVWMVDGLVEVLRQHRDWVTGVAAQDDVLVTCSRDESVGIWGVDAT